MDATSIKQVHEIIADVLRTRAHDHRSCYTRVYAQPPSGTLVLECSDRDIGEAILDRVRDGSRGVAIGYRLLPNGATLPERFVVTNSVADVRREPAHAAELVSQAIYGDSLTPLKIDGDWCLVRLSDGYIGWVRSWHLEAVTAAAVERFEREALYWVRDNIIQIFKAADADALPVSDAVVGTRLIVSPSPKRGWRRVTLVDGREGFARSRGIGPVPRAGRVVRTGLASTGMRFLGIPYLWGGTTPKGFDCSGLVQRIYQLHGVAIPRDSDQQALHGAEKPAGAVGSLSTGDLLFFGQSGERITHVAMYLSDGRFLHAHGQVKIGSLDPSHGIYEPGLARDWRVTRDPLRS